MAANVFDVVAKVCTVATNFVRLFKAGSARLTLALATRVLGGIVMPVKAGYTLAVGYFFCGVVALGFKFMGFG